MKIINNDIISYILKTTLGKTYNLKIVFNSKA